MCKMSIRRISKNDPLKGLKRDAVKAGKELGYLPMTLNSVVMATTEGRIACIMSQARNCEIGSWVY